MLGRRCLAWFGASTLHIVAVDNVRTGQEIDVHAPLHASASLQTTWPLMLEDDVCPTTPHTLELDEVAETDTSSPLASNNANVNAHADTASHHRTQQIMFENVAFQTTPRIAEQDKVSKTDALYPLAPDSGNADATAILHVHFFVHETA